MVKTVTDHTFTLEQDGLLNTVNIDRVSRMPRPSGLIAPPEEDDTPRGQPDAIAITLPEDHDTRSDTDDVSPTPVAPAGQADASGEPPLYQPLLDDTQQGEEDPGRDSQQYAIDRIVEHQGDRLRRWYRVRWYGYDATQDNWEPDDLLPDNFITRYKRGRPGRSFSRYRESTTMSQP